VIYADCTARKPEYYIVPAGEARDIIPAGVGPGGNIPVYFEVLSYAATLTVTAIADPDHFPELGTLADALRAELDLIIYHPRARG
jgi:hypothetical protein